MVLPKLLARILAADSLEDLCAAGVLVYEACVAEVLVALRWRTFHSYCGEEGGGKGIEAYRSYRKHRHRR